MSSIQTLSLICSRDCTVVETELDDGDCTQTTIEGNLWTVPSTACLLRGLTRLKIKGYYVGCDAQVSVTVSVLNSMTRLEELTLEYVAVQSDHAVRLTTLKSLSMSVCTLEGTSTYDLLRELDECCTDLQYLTVKNTFGELYRYSSCICSKCSSVLPALSRRELPISNLIRLRSLVLTNVLLNAAIPRTVSRLTELQCLDICRSRVTGDIPIELCRLPSLRTACIIHEGYIDSVPDEGRRRDIRVLY